MFALLYAEPARFYINTEGVTCRGNDRLASFAEAEQFHSTICALNGLGQWDIVNLAGGGSFDGSGYQCRFRPEDNRGPFATAVCVHGERGPTLGAAACPVVANIWNAPATIDLLNICNDWSDSHVCQS